MACGLHATCEVLNCGTWAPSWLPFSPLLWLQKQGLQAPSPFSFSFLTSGGMVVQHGSAYNAEGAQGSQGMWGNRGPTAGELRVRWGISVHGAVEEGPCAAARGYSGTRCSGRKNNSVYSTVGKIHSVGRGPQGPTVEREGIHTAVGLRTGTHGAVGDTWCMVRGVYGLHWYSLS